jgi:hypothetical protein
MTENIGNVRMPLADELCAAVRAVVEKLGGAEFFGKLDDNTTEFNEEFSNESLRPILARCLEDLTFRAQFLAQVSTESDREFLSHFLDSWDLWKELFPHDHNWTRLALAGPAIQELFGPIPYRANEFFRCVSTMQLDSYFEDLRLKSSIQLGYANKQLGGDGALIVAGSVSSFLESLNIALNSLVLNEAETLLFKLSRENDIISGVTKELNNITTTVDILLKQFEGMIVSAGATLRGSGSGRVPPGEGPPSV